VSENKELFEPQRENVRVGGRKVHNLLLLLSIKHYENVQMNIHQCDNLKSQIKDDETWEGPYSSHRRFEKCIRLLGKFRLGVRWKDT
jgi:hypothetical protein